MGLTEMVGEDAFTMFAKVTGLEELSKEQQFEIGQQWLLILYGNNIKVDGVKVEFEYEH